MVRPEELIRQEEVKKLFPDGKDDEFFEALYGGVEEGAFDIRFEFDKFNEKDSTLVFNFLLKERPGKCMVCSLTYGLPEVFKRSPIINLKGIVDGIDKLIQPHYKVETFDLSRTMPLSPKVNVIKLLVKISRNAN